MKKGYIAFMSLLVVAVLITSAFAFLSPRAGDDDGTVSDGDTADTAGGAADEDMTDDGAVTDGSGEDADIAAGDTAADDGTVSDGEADDGTADDGSVDDGEAETEADEALNAAKLLEGLGIMEGIGKNDDGTTDFDLDSTLTREQAAAVIGRARGYSGSGVDPAFPCVFDDVSDWATGVVGYLNASGIVNGVSDTSFNGSGEVTGMELLAMSLRGIGYAGKFEFEETMALAESFGLTDGRLGEGTEPVSRGDTAIIVRNLLTADLAGTSRTLLTCLVESGKVTLDKLAELGVQEYATGIVEGARTAADAMERYAPLMVTVETRDLWLEPIGSFIGSIVRDGLVAMPLEELRGAAYVEITDSQGAGIPFINVRCYDEANGVAYLNCGAVLPDITPILYPDGLKTAMSYVVSDKATPILGPKYVSARPGLPVMDTYGNFVGITTENGVDTINFWSTDEISLFELEKKLWPDDAPKFLPRGVDPTKPMIALTYDDGPSSTYTPQILDVFEEYNSAATFFECGYMLANYTGSLMRMEEMGCEIGNHSYSHANLNNLSYEGVKNEIDKTNDLIRAVVGHDATVVRCPYGNSNATVRSAIDAPLIYWNVDTLDWKTLNSASVINEVLKFANPDGYIVLMHSIHASTAAATRTIVPSLIERGYQLVTVSELAYFRGVEMQNGTVYYSFQP